MKKVLFIIAMALTGLVAHAQQVGYLSCNAVMQSMPEYTQMLQDMALLRSQYEAEQKRVEEDFNNKYEEFLDGQAAFPKTILQKRQSELQEMLDKNVAFKKESQRLLAEAEETMTADIRAIVAQAVEKIGQERGYAFILNTDTNAATWMNPTMGEDITEAVQKLLKD